MTSLGAALRDLFDDVMGQGAFRTSEVSPSTGRGSFAVLRDLFDDVEGQGAFSDDAISVASSHTRSGTTTTLHWTEDEAEDWGLERLFRPHARRYRALELDPFCTDQSFFGSGRFRPTAYCPRDREVAPHYVPRRDPRRGPYTGAARPDYPRVFRKFGDNTRARVMPYRRYTHMHETGFSGDVVGSQPVPSLIHPHAALGQSGSEAVLAAAGLTRVLGTSARGHYLLDGSG